jgi:hypothetical protein
MTPPETSPVPPAVVSDPPPVATVVVAGPAAEPTASSSGTARFWSGAATPAGPIELVSGPAARVETPKGTLSSPALKLIWAATATGTASSTAQSALRPAMR